MISHLNVTVDPSRTPALNRNPARLVRDIIAAVKPLLETDRGSDFTLADDYSDIDVYRALLSTCSNFTVADAVRALEIIHAALDIREQAASKKQSQEYGALFEADAVLEEFIAIARPTGPNCVSALAQYNSIIEDDDEPRLSEVLRPIAAKTLCEGVSALRSNIFVQGERFGSAGDGNLVDGWFYRIDDRLKKWRPSRVDAA